MEASFTVVKPCLVNHWQLRRLLPYNESLRIQCIDYWHTRNLEIQPCRTSRFRATWLKWFKLAFYHCRSGPWGYASVPIVNDSMRLAWTNYDASLKYFCPFFLLATPIKLILSVELAFKIPGTVSSSFVFDARIAFWAVRKGLNTYKLSLSVATASN